MAWTRRQFLTRVPLALGGVAAVDAFGVEPDWLDVTRLDYSRVGAGKTIVHLTDLHYRGDRSWLESILQTTHDQKPDYVFFTGDLVDGKDKRFLPEALGILKTIGLPLYGVLGNHDPADSHSQELFQNAAAATGGMWLFNQSIDLGTVLLDGTWGPHGMAATSTKPRILLSHYPMAAERSHAAPYDLVLAGHSHGGQCRIPGIPPLYLPDFVGPYVAGHFDTAGGPLYVSRGLGTTGLPVRFACRPELAVIRI